MTRRVTLACDSENMLQQTQGPPIMETRHRECTKVTHPSPVLSQATHRARQKETGIPDKDRHNVTCKGPRTVTQSDNEAA